MRHLSADKNMDEFTYPSVIVCRALLKNKGYSKRQIANAYYYLKKRKYIKLRQDIAGRTTIALTLLGAMRYLKKFPLTAQDKKLPRGTKSIIILNIPETRRSLRDFLRHKLSRDKFAHPARGLYISDFQLCTHMAQFAEVLKLKNYLIWGEFKEGR